MGVQNPEENLAVLQSSSRALSLLEWHLNPECRYTGVVGGEGCGPIASFWFFVFFRVEWRTEGWFYKEDGDFG